VTRQVCDGLVKNDETWDGCGTQRGRCRDQRHGAGAQLLAGRRTARPDSSPRPARPGPSRATTKPDVYVDIKTLMNAVNDAATGPALHPAEPGATPPIAGPSA
jgi:hypothetical protein